MAYRKSFKAFVNEDANKEDNTFEIAKTGKDSKSAFNPAQLSKINDSLARATFDPCLTPYTALGAISRCLAQFNIIVPQNVFLNTDGGDAVFEVQNFGRVSGVDLDGNYTNNTSNTLYLYFNYEPAVNGYYDIFAMIVTPNELDTLLDDDDKNGDATVVVEAKMTKSQREAAIRRFMSHDPKAGESIIATGNKHRAETKAFKSAKAEINRHKKKEIKESGGAGPEMTKPAYNGAKDIGLSETLSKNASAKTYIDDFVHSKNKMFSGDTKKERIKRALGAYYGQKNEAKQNLPGEVDPLQTNDTSLNLLKEKKKKKLNEVSKKLLGRYIRHASSDLAKKSHIEGQYTSRIANKYHNQKSDDVKILKKLSHKIAKRKHGIQRASAKMEEPESYNDGNLNLQRQ